MDVRQRRMAAARLRRPGLHIAAARLACAVPSRDSRVPDAVAGIRMVVREWRLAAAWFPWRHRRASPANVAVAASLVDVPDTVAGSWVGVPERRLAAARQSVDARQLTLSRRAHAESAKGMRTRAVALVAARTRGGKSDRSRDYKHATILRVFVIARSA
jgi:hypothetical protein